MRLFIQVLLSCYWVNTFFSLPSIYLFRNYQVISTAIFSLAFNSQSALHLDIQVTEKEVDGYISSSVKWIAVWKIKINRLHNHFVLLKPIWIKGKKSLYMKISLISLDKNKHYTWIWAHAQIAILFSPLPAWSPIIICTTDFRLLPFKLLSKAHTEMVWENMKCGVADCHSGYVILGFHVHADLSTDNFPTFFNWGVEWFCLR